MTAALNTYEYAARQRKCALLVDILVRAKFGYATCRLLEPKDWALVAEQARVKPPSAETVEMVLDTLKSLEKPLSGGDPFKGF